MNIVIVRMNEICLDVVLALLMVYLITKNQSNNLMRSPTKERLREQRRERCSENMNTENKEFNLFYTAHINRVIKLKKYF